MEGNLLCNKCGKEIVWIECDFCKLKAERDKQSALIKELVGAINGFINHKWSHKELRQALQKAKDAGYE